jgi:hypothetical protein
MASRPYQMKTAPLRTGGFRPQPGVGIKPRALGILATKPRITRPPITHGPRRRRPVSGGVVYEPWPVFDRVRNAASTEALNNGEPRRMTWFPPETLDASAARTDPGLFVVERRQDDVWLPVHAGMAPSGIGQPLRWLAAAPALLGVVPDLTAVRIRPAVVTMDPALARDRATLRALRDHVSESIAASGPTARLFRASPQSPASEQILAQINWKQDGVKPPYLKRN